MRLIDFKLHSNGQHFVVHIIISISWVNNSKLLLCLSLFYIFIYIHLWHMILILRSQECNFSDNTVTWLTRLPSRTTPPYTPYSCNALSGSEGPAGLQCIPIQQELCNNYCIHKIWIYIGVEWYIEYIIGVGILVFISYTYAIRVVQFTGTIYKLCWS